MSEERIYRAMPVDDLRVLGDGRTVTVRLLTYGREYRVSDDGQRTYTEVWRSGAFARSMAHGRDAGVPVQFEHDLPNAPKSLPVGATRRAWDSDGALMVETRISDTSMGRDLVELLRDGVVRGVSLEAQVFNSKKVLNGVERSEGALRRVVFTTVPQYADAAVLAIRSEPEPDLLATPLLDSLKVRLDAMHAFEV